MAQQKKAKPQIEEAERRIRSLAGTFLDLSSLGLKSIPESVRARGEQIGALVFDYNELRELPAWLGELHNLDTLSLAENNLIDVKGFSKLQLLDTFYLEGNRLEVVPNEIRELKALTELVLSDNKLSELPSWLADLPELRSLYVDGNTSLDLPKEIAHSGDAKTILDYYFRTAGSGAALPLNEFKLIIVGRGGVGKTSLVHRLVTDQYKEFKRTPGIKITKWPVTIDGDEVRAHIWDFGGQEIMHGTHRFFMTERAVYLILISGREGTEDHDAEYWLSLVRSFAGDVPVIVLLHKAKDYPFELNRELLREKYGRNLVFIETDSAGEGYGITTLREEICRQAKTLSGLKAAWPAEWRRIKEDLPKKSKSWLTFDDFRKFCRVRGVTEASDQELLADSLHALGLMLSYRREEALRNFGVLNPQWVTKGIYQMLNAPELRKDGGKFTVQSFADVLPEKAYPKNLHGYLLALMRKFQLCHPLDVKGDRYLIPELLTKEEPADLDKQFDPRTSLGFAYHYDSVLPEGLLPRFIVDTYVHREPKLAWRTGVVLERGNSRALVRGDVQGRNVNIRVTGSPGGRRELLGIIREHFERIHRTYEKLPVTEIVPIPHHPGASVKYELLLKYEQSSRQTIPVEIGDELIDYKVTELLDGVDLPGALRKTPGWTIAGSGYSVFISYSHKDAVYLDQLKGALVPYERTGELSIWADPLLKAGDTWEQEILASIDRADIVILLLSNDFLASDYAMNVEVPRALERSAVVPVVIRPCRFEKLPLGKIQAILPGGKPVSEHDRSDNAWLEVTKQLDRVIEKLTPKR